MDLYNNEKGRTYASTFNSLANCIIIDSRTKIGPPIQIPNLVEGQIQ